MTGLEAAAFSCAVASVYEFPKKRVVWYVIGSGVGSLENLMWMN